MPVPTDRPSLYFSRGHPIGHQRPLKTVVYAHKADGAAPGSELPGPNRRRVQAHQFLALVIGIAMVPEQPAGIKLIRFGAIMAK